MELCLRFKSVRRIEPGINSPQQTVVESETEPPVP
jgi:hypothetical protein